jgi:hypothetical protein
MSRTRFPRSRAVAIAIAPPATASARWTEWAVVAAVISVLLARLLS